MSRGMPNQQITRKDKKVVEPSSSLQGKPGRTQPGVEKCRECGAIHFHDRWYLEKNLPPDALKQGEVHETTCPADRQIRDNNPGGILTLVGAFKEVHYGEIMSLIQHEDEKAQGVNPLERIMEIRHDEDGTIEISTTNEFLVQRLGRKIHKAYSGDLDLKFGGSDVPVRVKWSRA